MSNWKPIKTVPENETVLMALIDKETGRYWGYQALCLNTRTNDEAYRLDDGMTEFKWAVYYTPTHWMHVELPEDNDE